VRINATRAVSVSGATPPKARALAGAAWYWKRSCATSAAA
jgi:hypothetical protein